MLNITYFLKGGINIDMRYKIRLQDATTSKREKDSNGYLIIKDNPIAKAGVFDYLMGEVVSQCDAEEADNIVKVCREFKDLEANKDLFCGKPIKWAHYWVGKDGETQTADGAIIGEVRAEEPYLKADLIIYNYDLIKEIEEGNIVELSPGYEADIVKGEGSYNGEGYSFIQKLKEVNHLAVVEVGRSGSDLRIYDKGDLMKKKLKIKDSGFLKKLIARLKDEDTTEEAIEDSASDVLAQIVSIAQGEGSDDDKLLAIIEAVKSLQTQDEEAEETTDEETKSEETQEAQDKCEREDEGIEPQSEAEISLTSEELVEVIEKVADSKIKKLQDSMKKEAQEVAKAYKDVSSTLGTSFDFVDKSASDIYRFGYEAISKQKLADSMDSKTAFYAVSGIKVATKVKAKDSVESSDFKAIDELISKHIK